MKNNLLQLFVTCLCRQLSCLCLQLSFTTQTDYTYATVRYTTFILFYQSVRIKTSRLLKIRLTDILHCCVIILVFNLYCFIFLKIISCHFSIIHLDKSRRNCLQHAFVCNYLLQLKLIALIWLPDFQRPHVCENKKLKTEEE